MEATNIRARSGYTLLEMLIVVSLLSLAAALAVPSSTSSDHHRLASAGAAVADALRLAREEARRTGTMHGVAVDLVADRIRVFRLDEAPTPNQKIFDVYHPVSKQQFTIAVGEGAYRGVSVDAVTGQMLGGCNDAGNIAFDAYGVVRCPEPTTTRINGAGITLGLGARALNVSVDIYTGRVSIQ